MSVEFALWMFPVLMLFIFLGFPVALSFVSVGLIFGAMLICSYPNLELQISKVVTFRKSNHRMEDPVIICA